MIWIHLTDDANYTDDTCHSIFIVFLLSGGLSIIHQPTEYQKPCMGCGKAGSRALVPFASSQNIFMNPGPHM